MADSLEDTIAAMMDGADPAPAAEPEPVVEAEPAVEPAPEGEEPAEEPAPEPAEGRDEHGRFKAKDPAEPKQLVKPPAAPAEPEKAPEPPKPLYRPPQSWKPEVRAALEKADPAIQAEAARLDREYRGIMAQNAEIKRQHGEATQFRQQVESVVTPVAGIFAAEGVHPMQGVANVVQTYAQLHYGGPQDKARILAGLIARFSSVDDVNTALTNPAAAPQPQYRPPTPAQPQVDVRAVVQQQFAALREQAAAGKAQRDWSAFEASKPEHLEIVLPSMRALVRAWAIENDEAEKEGQAPPYPTESQAVYKLAYDTARAHNPQLRAWDEQKKAAAAAKANASNAAKARAAGSSVRTAPSLSATGRKLSLQEEVEAQYNAAEGR